MLASCRYPCSGHRRWTKELVKIGSAADKHVQPSRDNSNLNNSKNSTTRIFSSFPLEILVTLSISWSEFLSPFNFYLATRLRIIITAVQYNARLWNIKKIIQYNGKEMAVRLRLQFVLLYSHKCRGFAAQNLRRYSLPEEKSRVLTTMTREESHNEQGLSALR